MSREARRGILSHTCITEVLKCVQISWLALTRFHERIPAVSVCSPVGSAEGKLICYPDVNKCASRNGPLHIRQRIMPLDFT